MGERISEDLERINLKFVDYKAIEKLILNIEDKEFLGNVLSYISRINTLSMIMYARSGHVGTSLSSMEIFQCFREKPRKIPTLRKLWLK